MSRRDQSGGQSADQILGGLGIQIDWNPGGGSGSGSSRDPEDLPYGQQVIGDTSTFTQGYPVQGQIQGGLSPASAYGTPSTYYIQSDVYLPLSLSREARWQLQQALYNAGWIRGDIENPGQWTTQSQTAFRNLLEYANQAGVDWRDALGESLAAQQPGSGFGGGGGGSAPAPLTISLPNEADVRRSVEDLFRQVTDVDGGEEFYQHVTDQYMDHLRNMQMADHAAATRRERRQSGETLETEQAPTLQTFAEDMIEQERPKQVKNARIGDAEESFMDVMTRSYG